MYTVRVVGADSSVGQGCTVCTTSPCLYVHHITHVAANYNISVTPINEDGRLGSQNSTTFRELTMHYKLMLAIGKNWKFHYTVVGLLSAYLE